MSPGRNHLPEQKYRDPNHNNLTDVLDSEGHSLSAAEKKLISGPIPSSYSSAAGKAGDVIREKSEAGIVRSQRLLAREAITRLLTVSNGPEGEPRACHHCLQSMG